MSKLNSEVNNKYEALISETLKKLIQSSTNALAQIENQKQNDVPVLECWQHRSQKKMPAQCVHTDIVAAHAAALVDFDTIRLTKFQLQYSFLNMAGAILQLKFLKQ